MNPQFQSVGEGFQQVMDAVMAGFLLESGLQAVDERLSERQERGGIFDGWNGLLDCADRLRLLLSPCLAVFGTSAIGTHGHVVWHEEVPEVIRCCLLCLPDG